LNGQATVTVIGQLFHNDSQHHYQCVVSGVAFTAILIDSQTLQCHLAFDSTNMPGTSSSRGNYLYVMSGGIQSNALSLYFTSPPSIQSGVMVKKNRITLAGSNFPDRGAFCVFSWGETTPLVSRDNNAYCDVKGLQSKVSSFQVRVSAFGQVSNWSTISVPVKWQ